MIVGIGADIVEIGRIKQLHAKYGNKFLQRIFTAAEIKYANSKSAKSSFYAKRFAGKEAVLKALGTGLAFGISWQDIEILNTETGQPVVLLCGRALEILINKIKCSKAYKIHISLTDERDIAQAFVVIEEL